jgi:hypothetical protein
MRTLVLTLALFATARAEILDRVVAVVNSNSVNMRRVITLSDLQKEREVQGVLGRNLKTDHDAMEFLIDRYLVEDQMQFAGVDVDDSEIDARLAEITDFRGVPRADIRTALSRELKAEAYYETRFGQFIRPTDQELHDYYDSVVKAEERPNRGAPPSFEQVMQSPDELANLVKGAIREKRAHEVEMWLDSLRKRSTIETFE